jgi:hypothetical protein
MPAYTLYLLQPLDIGVFSPFKKAYEKLLKGYITASNNYINKEDFLSLYPDTHKQVFTSANIYSGFREAGLKPLNLEYILSILTFQLRTPTPSLVKDLIFSAF